MTDSYVAIAQKLVDLIKADPPLVAVKDVYYGDQNNIPRTPSACVDPGEKRRQLNGAPRRVMTTMINYIIVYHYEVKSLQDVRKEADLLAESIETRVHEDVSLGGLCIDSMVIAIESGYLTRGRSLYRASRLTVEAREQVQLPS